MSVSRNTSRCVIAASILMLSSTTFISSALAQSATAGQGGQGGTSQSGMFGGDGGNATVTGLNLAGAPGINVTGPLSGGGGGGGADSVYYYPNLFSASNSLDIQAQYGGIGGSILLPGDGGGGGGGGGGASVHYVDSLFLQSFENLGHLTGGNGGSGGSVLVPTVGANGGSGGGGGTALIFDIPSKSTASTILNSGTVTGGNGGMGGYGSTGGSGGSGGDGIDITGELFKVTNTGQISGGQGGHPGIGQFTPDQVVGNGGVGLRINGNDNYVTNSGTISGGATAQGYLFGPIATGGSGVLVTGNRNVISNYGAILTGLDSIGLLSAPALKFSGNDNRLIIGNGYSFNSSVISAGDRNVLDLGGSTNSYLNIGLYSGFSAVEKTTNAKWTVVGTTGDSMPWNIQAGTLQVGDGATLGHIGNGNVNLLNGGTTIAFNNDYNATASNQISGFGGLTKLGTGTLTLTGMNSYSGVTDIESGTLALSGQGRINSSNEVIVNGTLDISNVLGAQVRNLTGNGTINLGASSLSIDNTIGTTFGGQIGGTGGISLSSGALLLTGENTFTGSIGLSNGTLLQMGDGGTTGSIVGNILNNGTVTFNRSDDVVYGGEITGTGHFVQVGSGKLTLTATSSSRGDVLIGPNSTLQLGNGGTTGLIGGTNFTGTITNLGTLIYDRSNAFSWKGIYAGNGDIIKEGTNTLTLTGDSSGYAGSTTVKSGKLIVGNNLGNGKLGGNVTVFDGATLGGYGTLGSGPGSLISIQSGGILSPGNSIGTLTINGDLTLQPGSYLMTELAGDGSADLVNVTGRANIGGSHLVITALDPETSYQAGQNYNILSAANLVNGQFADVTSNSAFLTFTLDPDQSSNAFNVALKPIASEPEPNNPDPGGNPGQGENPKPTPLFTTVAETKNEFATAQALDSLSQTGSSLALYNRLLMLSADEARAAFNNLSGEAYASAKGALINQSQFINSAITNWLQQANGSTPTAPVATMNYASEAKKSEAFETVTAQADTGNLYTGWGYVYGAWSEQDSTSNTSRMKSSVGGFVTGIDRLVYENWRLGLLAGYSHTSFDVDSSASSGSSDNYTIGAYTGTEWQMSDGNALAFSSGLAYTWHQLDMNRSVAFPVFNDSLSADYDAGTFQIFGELGYKIRLPKAVLEPYANLSYVRLKTDGFNEDGQTAAALSMESDTTDTTFSTLGFRASTTFDLGSIPTTARADLGWRHAAGDVNPVSTASFLGSNAFTVTGAPIAKDTAIIEAGLDFVLSKDATLGVSYSGQFGSGAQRNGVNASLKVSF